MEGIRAKFVAAWAACENPELDSENPHYKNRYASLKSTLKAVREACNGQGIAYTQRLAHATTDDGISFDRRELVSSVTDGAEEIELSRFPVECPPNPQSFGSNLTYPKRQQAQADWGITGEPDDDGEAAANAAKGPRRASAKPRKPASSRKPQADAGALKAAKSELWAACKDYAAAHGADPGAIADGCLKRPDKRDEPGWYAAVAEELRAEA